MESTLGSSILYRAFYTVQRSSLHPCRTHNDSNDPFLTQPDPTHLRRTRNVAFAINPQNRTRTKYKLNNSHSRSFYPFQLVGIIRRYRVIGSAAERRIRSDSVEMITRSKLVEQLREYQIRSHHKWPIIQSFSPKPQIITRSDVVVALSYGLLFCLLMISSYATLYYRYFKVSAVFIFLGVFLPVSLKVSRKRKLARRRERRMMLPLSM